MQLVQRLDTFRDRVEASKLPIQDLVETSALVLADEPRQSAPQQRVRAVQPGDPDNEHYDRGGERNSERGERRLLERHRGGAYGVRYPRLSVAKKHRVRTRSRRAVEAA